MAGIYTKHLQKFDKTSPKTWKLFLIIGYSVSMPILSEYPSGVRGRSNIFFGSYSTIKYEVTEAFSFVMDYYTP